MVLELRPAHDPTKTYGFVGVVVSVEDLSASIWLWHRDGRPVGGAEGDHDPGRAAPTRRCCRRCIAPFGAVPPLVTDIDLSVDDQWLYVSCWGTGELKRYDVSDPFHPREAGSVRIGGIVGAGRRTRPTRTRRWPAARRWSRCPATAGGSTSPTRCTAPGTTSSTRTASAPGWRSSTSASRRRDRLRRALLPARGLGLARAAPAPGPAPGRRRLLRLLLLPVTRVGRCSSPIAWRWGSSTASTRRWAGCSRWRSACRRAVRRTAAGRGPARAAPDRGRPPGLGRRGRGGLRRHRGRRSPPGR